MKPLPELLTSHFSADRALREAITWRRVDGMLCQNCEGPLMAGFLDGDQVATACSDCPTLFPPEKPTT